MSQPPKSGQIDSYKKELNMKKEQQQEVSTP